MQALLSRAGQAQRAGCRACGTAVDALGKRATAARRKPTFAELFTACYSSVFATAALVDAVRKDDRRQELDRQLEEARRELAELQERGLSDDRDTEPTPSKLTTRQMNSLCSSLKTIYSTRPYMKEIHKPATISESDLVDALKQEHYGCLGEAALRNARQPSFEHLERAIIKEEADSSIYYRESLTMDHLFKESLSTEHLIRKLLDRAAYLPDDAPCPSLQEARAILDKGDPGYTFRSINPGMARKNTMMLNKNIRSLISASNLGMKERVGRVCFNLLASAHPPDMHTYNTLIVAFDKSGQYALADAIVYSFFYHRLLQPTPSTFVAILNHYKCTNNHGAFFRALACITGDDRLTGGKVRRRHVEDIQESPILHRWASDRKQRTRSGNFVWEHVPLTKPLSEEIITGLLHFKLFDQAASVFVSCLRSGVDLSMRLTRQLIDECISSLDWRGAVRLIRGIVGSQAKWKRLLRIAEAESGAYIGSRVPVLLDICGLGEPERIGSDPFLLNLGISRDELREFLEKWEYKHIPRDLEDIARSKSKVLQLESLSKEVDFVRKTTLSIESKLMYADFSIRSRTLMGLHIGDISTKRSLQLSQEFVRLREQHYSGPPSRLLLEECQAFEMSASKPTDEIQGKQILATAISPDLTPPLEIDGEAKNDYSPSSAPAEAIFIAPEKQGTSGPYEVVNSRLEAGPLLRKPLSWPVAFQGDSGRFRAAAFIGVSDGGEIR